MPGPQLVRAGSNIRGTQSFVHIMASVWRRPALVALELAWRWIFGIILLRLLWTRNPDLHDKLFDASWWSQLGDHLLHHTAVLDTNTGGPLSLLALLIIWAALSALSRDSILRKLDPRLQQRNATVVVLAILRVLAFSAVLAIWVAAFASTSSSIVQQSDPNYVLGFGLMVTCTLLLFMLWSVVSWIFPIATVLAMSRNLSLAASLRAAARSGPLRGKLIEINLVMGIVKVALIVLAMVFSATPLPFQSYTTDGFLHSWWIGIAILYLLASDYFHVVRLASTVALCRAYD